MKKIVIMVPALCVGGAENMAVQLFSALDRKKYDVTLLVMSKRHNTVLEDYLSANPDFKVYYFDKEPGFSLKTIFKVYHFLCKIKPDVIHTHLTGCTYAIFYALLHKVKIIHTIHTRPACELPLLLSRLLKLLYKTGKAVPVAISNTILMETSEFYNIKNEKIEMIHNPVDVKKFTPENYKKENSTITFINVGRLNKVKNQRLILNAFCEVKKTVNDIQLIIVGDGELKDELLLETERLNLRDSVTFTGNIHNVEDRLRQADVFILSSEYEGLPLSILEAMAAGLPIIATNVGGVPDIVEDNGILIEKNNKEQLTAAMLKLIQDNKLRQSMADNSRNAAQQYDISIIAEKYQQLYNDYS